MLEKKEGERALRAINQEIRGHILENLIKFSPVSTREPGRFRVDIPSQIWSW